MCINSLLGKKHKVSQKSENICFMWTVVKITNVHSTTKVFLQTCPRKLGIPGFSWISDFAVCVGGLCRFCCIFYNFPSFSSEVSLCTETRLPGWHFDRHIHFLTISIWSIVVYLELGSQLTFTDRQVGRRADVQAARRAHKSISRRTDRRTDGIRGSFAKILHACLRLLWGFMLGWFCTFCSFVIGTINLHGPRWRWAATDRVLSLITHGCLHCSSPLNILWRHLACIDVLR